jgi:hypothetical protein
VLILKAVKLITRKILDLMSIVEQNQLDLDEIKTYTHQPHAEWAATLTETIKTMKELEYQIIGSTTFS